MTCACADDVCLHHTRLEALSPSRWREQRARSLGLCGLEPSLGPHAVLFREGAERASFAREGQVRGRGSPPRPWASLAACEGAGACVPARRACPLAPSGRPARAPVKTHATAMTRAAREGAMPASKASGLVFMWRWTTISLSWCRTQRYMLRAWRAIPQENGCGVVSKRLRSYAGRQDAQGPLVLSCFKRLRTPCAEPRKQESNEGDTSGARRGGLVQP